MHSIRRTKHFQLGMLLVTLQIVASSAKAECQYDIQVLGTNPATYWCNDAAIITDVRVGTLRARITEMRDDSCDSGRQQILELAGQIDGDSWAVLERLADDMTTCTVTGVPYLRVIYLSSTGGFLEDGFRLGRTIKEEDFATILAETTLCASACAVAFLGGQRRVMSDTSVLLFHAPYRVMSSGEILCDRESTDLLTYYGEMLHDDSADLLYSRTMENCSQSSGWTLNRDAAQVFDILAPNPKSAAFGEGIEWNLGTVVED